MSDELKKVEILNSSDIEDLRDSNDLIEKVKIESKERPKTLFPSVEIPSNCLHGEKLKAAVDKHSTDDYLFSRLILREFVSNTADLVFSHQQATKMTRDPKDLEALAAISKQLIDATSLLMPKSPEVFKPAVQNNTTNNILKFDGTPTDLLRMMGEGEMECQKLDEEE